MKVCVIPPLQCFDVLFVFQEVKNILQHAIERNMIRRALGAKRQAFESWRQVVETSFAICQHDVFPGEARETVILDLLHEALNKVRFLFVFIFIFQARLPRQSIRTAFQGAVELFFRESWIDNKICSLMIRN